MDEDLAEYLGIHFGDGNLSIPTNYDYRICICLNLKEKTYADHVQKLFRQLFNKEMRYSEDKKRHAIYLKAYHKKTWEHIHSLGAPIGRKDQLHIPETLQEKEHLAAFLRGLFDTDGCTTIQRDKGYTYHHIKISMKSRAFAEEVKEALSSLSITAYICKKSNKKDTGFDVTIRRKESFRTFMEVVGSRKREWGHWDSNPDPEVSSLKRSASTDLTT